VASGFGDQHIGRQVVVVVEEHMGLDARLLQRPDSAFFHYHRKSQIDWLAQIVQRSVFQAAASQRSPTTTHLE
jgi:hypothetical protein